MPSFIAKVLFILQVLDLEFDVVEVRRKTRSISSLLPITFICLCSSQIPSLKPKRVYHCYEYQRYCHCEINPDFWCYAQSSNRE